MLYSNTVVFTQFNAGTSGTAKTINWQTANRQRLSLTGNCTLTFTAPLADAILALKLTQDATGNRTVVWPAAVKWPAGTAVVLTTTANAVDIISLFYDSSVGLYYAQAIKDFR